MEGVITNVGSTRQLREPLADQRLVLAHLGLEVDKVMEQLGTFRLRASVPRSRKEIPNGFLWPHQSIGELRERQDLVMHEELVVAKRVFDTHRIGARALPFDTDGRLLLMRRVKGELEYLVSLGGGTEDDESVAEAAVRESFEEAGATVYLRGLVLVVLDPPPHPSLQYFYSAELLALDPSERSGREFSRTDRGTYELFFARHDSPELNLVQPPALQSLLRENWDLVRLTGR